MYVTVDIEDHIAVVTMDRPPVNAIEITMAVELRRRGPTRSATIAMSAFAILTAAGDRAFMAGVDLQTVGHKPTRTADSRIDPVRWPRDAMWAITDCAVPGHRGDQRSRARRRAGVRRVLRHHHRADNATFGATEINVGLLGASAHLSTLVGRHKAREMFFTGEVVTAAELHRLGSVRAVVPRAELLGVARELATTLAAKSPIALASRQGVDEPGRAPPVEGGVPDRAGLHRPDQRFEDAEEARAAFFERREPEWKWR